MTLEIPKKSCPKCLGIDTFCSLCNGTGYIEGLSLDPSSYPSKSITLYRVEEINTWDNTWKDNNNIFLTLSEAENFCLRDSKPYKILSVTITSTVVEIYS